LREQFSDGAKRSAFFAERSNAVPMFHFVFLKIIL